MCAMVQDQGLLFIGGLAQLARAPALQAGGQRFESVILHTKGKSSLRLPLRVSLTETLCAPLLVADVFTAADTAGSAAGNHKVATASAAMIIGFVIIL